MQSGVLRTCNHKLSRCQLSGSRHRRSPYARHDAEQPLRPIRWARTVEGSALRGGGAVGERCHHHQDARWQDHGLEPCGGTPVRILGRRGDRPADRNHRSPRRPATKSTVSSNAAPRASSSTFRHGSAHQGRPNLGCVFEHFPDPRAIRRKHRRGQDHPRHHGAEVHRAQVRACGRGLPERHPDDRCVGNDLARERRTGMPNSVTTGPN